MGCKCRSINVCFDSSRTGSGPVWRRDWTVSLPWWINYRSKTTTTRSQRPATRSLTSSPHTVPVRLCPTTNQWWKTQMTNQKRKTVPHHFNSNNIAQVSATLGILDKLLMANFPLWLETFPERIFHFTFFHALITNHVFFPPSTCQICQLRDEY